jgi:pimeloyl-ACP methyl ester carboxylesterase
MIPMLKKTMASSSDPQFFVRADGVRLAYRHMDGQGPMLVFLPGYRSDMLGGKALAIADLATENGQAVLRFDYSGCGESGGFFEDGTLPIWRDDAVALINHVTDLPVVLVGSSMGGWIALLIALELRSRARGIVGIAAAADFTDWGFSLDDQNLMRREGRLTRPADDGAEPMVTTSDFWTSGQANRLLDGPIDIHCPIRLLQSQQDVVVPWQTSLRIAENVRSADVQVTLIKDGDHRLSRDADLALLTATTARLLDIL